MDIAGLEVDRRRLGASLTRRFRIAARAKVSAAAPVPASEAVPALAPIGRVWRIAGVESDARVVQIVFFGSLLMMLDFNHVVVQPEYTQFVLHFLVPLAIVVFLWREDPRRYGLTLGKWRTGLPVSLAVVAVMAAIVWFLGHTPEFASYYAPLVHGRSGPQLVLDTGLELLAWEFLCRGWLLFGLARKYGTDAVWLQVMPFVLMHLYKPEIEQLSTVVGGAFFGILAWRTRSMLYGWLIHTFILVLVMASAAGYI